MTTTNTDTRKAEIVFCTDCRKTVAILEPRAHFRRTWWFVTAAGTSQAPSHKAAKERAQLHRRRPECGSPLRTERITDFTMPSSGDIHSAVFASRHSG